MMRCCGRLVACLLFITADAERFASDCGTPVAKGNPTIVNGVAAKYGTFPWNVGVYSDTANGTYGHICGGTLISSKLVISAAHCFHDESRGQLQDAKKFRIAAGKYYRDYDSLDDPYVQKSPVKSIDIPDRYIGYSGNYGGDIALVWVETPFSTTELVKPICVHWNILDGIEHPLDGQIGKVVGWGRTETTELSNDLKEIDLPFVPYDNCSAAVPLEFRNFLTPQDKFCAGHLNGSSVCEGDSGAGLCFEHNGLWYLRGIVSAIPRGTIDLGCDNNQYAAFTNVDPFLEWIHLAFDGASIATNGCTLPNQPMSGSYKLTCRDKCDGVPGSVVPRGSVLVHRCDDDYILAGNGVSTCGISGWNSLPTCIKACPPLATSNEDIVCEFGGQPVPCGSLMPPGTRGSLACPIFHKISGTYNSTYDQMTCLDEGEWDRPAAQCIPECGIMLDSEDLFCDTANGTNQYAGLPWEVEIHYLGSNQLIVGSIIQGTLIQPDLVLTAFSKQFFLDNNGQHRDLNDFAASAGHVRNLNTTEDFWQQKSKIVAFNHVEPMEDGDELARNNNVTVGLVLLRLATPFVMTTWVRPVCMDWDNRLVTEQLRKGNVGKAPQSLFGTNETSVDEGSGIDFTYLSHGDCRRLFIELYNYVFTSATFCAYTWIETTNTDSSDGLGISFESDGRWYLRGLVSGHFPRSAFLSASDRTYAAFINVGNFLEWIRTAYGDGSGCILPEQHKDGKFELVSCQKGCDTEPGSRVPTGSVLVHRCNQGWRLNGRDTSTCFNKEWDTLPKCIKQCPTLVSPSVAMICKYEGNRSPCGSHIAPGTTASLACKKFHKISDTHNSTNYEITCLDGGEWDRPTLQCVPECGKVVDSEDPSHKTVEGKIQYAALPWAVIITYTKSVEERYREFFGSNVMPFFNVVPSFLSSERIDSDFFVGTLIQPDLVLSVLDEKFFLGYIDLPRNIKRFMVAAGRYYNSNTSEYLNQQVSNVETFKYVNVTELQSGDRNVTGLVLLRLAAPFEMTIRVRPACVDWDNRLVPEQLREGNVGKVPKIFFGTEASVNGESSIDYMYLPREDCQRLLRKEKRNSVTTVEFCAHTLNTTTNTSENDSAWRTLGISFESDGRWYLRGLRSGHFPRSALLSASNETYTTFINVGNFLGWIRTAYDNGSGCILPEHSEHGSYELLSCLGMCNVDPGSGVPIGSVLVHRCNWGWMLEGKDTSQCTNEEWDSLPKCIKQCPTLASVSVDMVCKYEGKRSPCGSYMAPGTMASLACEEFYKVSGSQNSTNYEITCLNGGEWDRPTLQCIPECGTMVDSTEMLPYSYEDKIQHAALPWAVEVSWYVPSDVPNSIEGTLIQPDLVLTDLANEILWDDDGRPRDIERFRVSAGRYYYSETSEYSNNRVSYVESVNYVNITEKQRLGRLVTDLRQTLEKFSPGLLLLRLKWPFEMSTWVRPVCMDWDNRFVAEQLRKGNIGKVPKFAFATVASVDGKSGIDYTYLPREDCQRLLREEKRNSITTVEFCAHTLNTTTNIREDDSLYVGLGISYKYDGLWYLRGVLSGYFTSDALLSASNRNYATFINVGNFLEWIRGADGNGSGCILSEQQKDGKFELVSCQEE